MVDKVSEEKVLGKITRAEFGTSKDYPFLMGLELEFSLGDGTSIGCGGRYLVNISPGCRWESQERSEAIEKMVDHIHVILKDAKVNHVSDLVNKPVEVTIESNIFIDFRILTEVL